MKKINKLFILLIITLSLTNCQLDDEDGEDKAPTLPQIEVENFHNEFLESNNSSFDFGQLETGRSGFATFNIKNTGDQDLNISSIEVNNENFYVDNYENISIVRSGETIPFDVYFKPISETLISATLTIKSNSENNSAYKINLTAERIIEGIFLDVFIGYYQPLQNGGEFDFGSYDHSGYETRKFRIRNKSLFDLYIDQAGLINVDGDAFTLETFITNRTLEPGGEVEFSVTFKAADYPAGDYSSIIRIYSDSEIDSTFIVTLNGTIE